MVFKEIAIARSVYSSKEPSQATLGSSRVSSVQGLRNSYQKSKENDPFEASKD